MRYPIKLDKPRQTMQGPITHARAFHGVEGWELWGEIPGGGEIHLDTKYYRESPEMPVEWRGQNTTLLDNLCLLAKLADNEWCKSILGRHGGLSEIKRKGDSNEIP